MTTPDIERLEAEFRGALHRAYEADPRLHAALERSNPMLKICHDKLLAARQQAEKEAQEMEILKAIMRERVGSSGYSRSWLLSEGTAKEVLSVLRSAGWQITRATTPSVEAPAASGSPPHAKGAKEDGKRLEAVHGCQHQQGHEACLVRHDDGDGPCIRCSKCLHWLRPSAWAALSRLPAGDA